MISENTTILGKLDEHPYQLLRKVFYPGTLVLRIHQIFEQLNKGLQDLDSNNPGKSFRMDIYKNKETLLKWIWSCQTSQQLDLFTRLVKEYDASRFYHKIDPLETELVKTELSDAIIEQRIILAGKRMPMRVSDQYLFIPNERAVLLSE